MSVLLRVENLHSAYGLSRVLFGLNIEVRPGECICLLGRNGVGKSTTLRSIMGLVKVSAGRVLWKDKDVVGLPPNVIARRGIGYVPEDRKIFGALTVRENLEIGARAARRPGRWGMDGIYGLFPKLHELRDRNGGLLSGGEQQMLTIGRTLMGNPELLLLDEPSEGLAPLAVESLLQNIIALKRDGLTIVLAEQFFEFSLRVADRYYILEKGAIKHTGMAADLRDDKALRLRLLAF